jgi:hypothetical protein
VEGRITGSGRPSSSIRAAILRKWAVSGRLPSYGQLNSDARFMGMSMAYLAGSAYLEWLSARGGPDALRHLWARMTARQRRDFNTAFEGVFGDSPERLYGKFTAELTQRAVEVENSTDLREGELWLQTKRASGEPAVSADGKEIAIVERDDKGESKISIYSTGPNKEEKKLEERIAKMLKRDPEDVAPVRTKPVPRDATRTIKPIEGGDVSSPRWAGASILYTHKQPDRDGFLHSDLFIDGREVTHLADVRDADAFPDGKRAIAVRSRYGWTQLVKVDLQSGDVSEYTPSSIDRIVAHPRVNADGRVAWTEHDATGWHVVVDGQRRGEGFDPEWGAGGALYWSVARNGFIDVVRDGEPVTRSSGAAFQPAPSPDGSVYFMSLETEGFELRKIAGDSRAEARAPQTRSMVPALPPEPSTPTTFKVVSPSAPRAYGIGRQEGGFAFGGSWTAYDKTQEIGVRFGDVVGRLDTLLVAATGPDRGQAIASAWRGWPVTLAAHAFRLREERGVEVRAGREIDSRLFTTRFEAGTSSRAYASAAIRFRQRRTSEALRIAADSKDHFIATARASARFGDVRVALQADSGRKLSVGGFASTVVPQSFRIARVDEPALPHRSFFADRYRSGRIEVGSGALTFFWQRHDVGRNIDVRGLEVSLSAPPLGIIRSAAFDFTAGAAKVSESRGVKGWIALRWRP